MSKMLETQQHVQAYIEEKNKTQLIKLLEKGMKL